MSLDPRKGTIPAAATPAKERRTWAVKAVGRVRRRAQYKPGSARLCAELDASKRTSVWLVSEELPPSLR